MINYKINTNISGGHTSIVRSDGCLIPIANDNTDYQQFKKDIQNEVVLNDADGNPITGDALTTFLATMP